MGPVVRSFRSRRQAAPPQTAYVPDVVEVLEDPLATVERRGLAAEKTGRITLCLTLRPPSQAQALARWLEDRPRATR